VYEVSASKDQDITKVADIIKNYLEAKKGSLPQGVELEPFIDLTYYLNGSLNMMLENMELGGV
jgi:multidrug efflux pump subunit AcrB